MNRWVGGDEGPHVAEGSVEVRVEARSVGEASRFWGATPLEHLGPHERVRHDSLRRARDRTSYLEAHLLVREVAAHLLGCDPRELAVLQSCPGCRSEGHGVPTIRDAPGTGVSWTHTDGLVAAIAVQGRVCGIDAEWAPSSRDFRAPKAALTSEEVAWVARQDNPSIAFARLWTRKESLVKCGVMSLDEVVRTSLLAGDGAATHGHGVQFHDEVGSQTSDGRLVLTWGLGRALL